MLGFKKYAIEEFKNDSIDVQGACVISFLRKEVETVWASMEENGFEGADKDLYNSLVEVVNWVCDITDNEEMRIVGKL